MDEYSQDLRPEPPHDDESEMGVIGSILLSSRAVESVRDIVKQDDFYRDENRILYEQILTYHDAGFPVDDITVVVSKLRNAGKFDRIGGVAYLAKLSGSVPNAANASIYAETVAEKSRRRQLILYATEVLEKSYNPMGEWNSANIIGDLQSKLDLVGTEKVADIIMMHDAVSEMIDRVEAGKQSDRTQGIPTGIPRFDSMIGGSFPGELNVVLARPSIGKTSLGFQIAKHSSIQNRPSLFISLEMQEWELGGRFIAGESSLDTIAMRSGRVDESEFDIMRKIRDECEGMPFHLWRPKKSVTIEQMRAGVKMLKSSPGGCEMVVIDYLQKIRGTNQKEMRHEQLEHIIRASKDIATECELPVIMLAQAKRSEKNRPPTLEEIKGSSAVEDEANNVWAVHRDTRHSEEALISIAKARSGNTGDVTLGYNLKKTEFTDPVYDEY